jgi:hypothetical protein
MRPTSRSLLESRLRNTESVQKSVELGIDIELNDDERGVEKLNSASPRLPFLVCWHVVQLGLVLHDRSVLAAVYWRSAAFRAGLMTRSTA